MTQAIDQIVNSAGKTYYMSGGSVTLSHSTTRTYSRAATSRVQSCSEEPTARPLVLERSTRRTTPVRSTRLI